MKQAGRESTGRGQGRSVRLRAGRAVMILPLLACLGILRGAAAVAADSDPDPQQLLRVARMASTDKEASVRGQLRAGEVITPFTLKVDFGRLRFAFEKPERVIEVRLGDESSGVFDSKGNAVKKGVQEPVAEGTDVTVEDLSLGFLYWPDARLLGDELVRTRRAWKIELRPGRRGSEFAVVRVWLDQASGALLRIEGFDWEGRLLRRFEVVSGQRIDGQWMLKQMRIERFGPDSSSRPLGRSYLEILGKEDA